MDAVRGEMLEPCSGIFHKVEWQVLDDEEIIVRHACSVGEVEVFQPYGRVGVSGVFDDIWRRTEACREWCLQDPFCECLQSIGVRAQAASSFPNPGMSAMVVWVTVAIVWLILACQV